MSSERPNRQAILLVEDDAMLRDILGHALADEGHAVLAAADGEEALAMVSTLEQQLGLVVIDLLLPGMNGLQLADHLKRLNSPPPVLFISGIRPHWELPGPVLVKPFGPSAFLRQVNRIFPSGQPH